MRCRSYRNRGEALARLLPSLAFGDNCPPDAHDDPRILELLLQIKCSHCDKIIDDLHGMWSRGGHHWCSAICMSQDQPGTAQPPIPPIMRK